MIRRISPLQQESRYKTVIGLQGFLAFLLTHRLLQWGVFMLYRNILNAVTRAMTHAEQAAV